MNTPQPTLSHKIIIFTLTFFSCQCPHFSVKSSNYIHEQVPVPHTSFKLHIMFQLANDNHASTARWGIDYNFCGKLCVSQRAQLKHRYMYKYFQGQYTNNVIHVCRREIPQ